MSVADLLCDLEQRMAHSADDVSRTAWLGLADSVLEESDSSAVRTVSEAALRVCQRLYGEARSFDALPIALAVFQRAVDHGDAKLVHLASVASGLLSSDTADFAGAIDFHGRALEIMNALKDDAGAGRSWNNIGSAFCGVGRYELASASFRRALEQLETTKGPQFGRYSALTNLAQCAVHAGAVDSGLDSARLALQELQLGHTVFKIDPFSELLLRRNMVRLLVARGDLALAEEQVQTARLLAAQDGGVRASIAMATTQADIDIARGRFDIAATRLEKCLVAARPIRLALRDTLACIVRADEAVGNPARALARLQELSELMHDTGVEAATTHMRLSTWRQSISAFEEPALAETQARLARKRSAASVPSTWATLTRLALGNALRLDASAAHGMRVGALTQLLAQAHGLGPGHAMEIGLAAQVHDVGIAADPENLIGRFCDPASGPAAEGDLAHCEAGWKILCEDDHPRILLAREIAKYHHARIDGQGHPGGLAGHSIPLHARICAVADTYDNIMHAGQGAGGATIATGLSRLKSLSGTQLDPKLVGLFIDTLEDETRNEGIDIGSVHGLTSFHQLINSLSRTQR